MKEKSKKEFVVSYRVSSGIPFRWEYEIKNLNIVSFVRKDIINESRSKITCGGPITVNYVFKGLKKGKTTIIFRFVNFADNYVDQEEKYDVVVNDDLNINCISC